MDVISIDTAVKLVADHFAKEIWKFRVKAAREGKWQHDQILLSVDVEGGKTSFRLHFSGAQQLDAATLGALMDEVYRRSGFDDREAGKLQAASAALVSLPQPSLAEELDDEIKF